jgi:hypothetical protein
MPRASVSDGGPLRRAPAGGWLERGAATILLAGVSLQIMCSQNNRDPNQRVLYKFLDRDLRKPRSLDRDS